MESSPFDRLRVSGATRRFRHHRRKAPCVSGILLTVFLFTSTHAATAGEGKIDPPVWSYDVAELSTGEHLYAMRGWSEEVEGEPGRIAAVSESTYPRGSVKRAKAVFTLDDPARCLLFETTTRNEKGEVLVHTTQRFTPEAFPMLRGPLPVDAYPPDAPLGYVVTRLGLGKRKSASFHTVVAESLLGMELWVEGRETVRVPAGEFDAWRIHMRVTAETLFPQAPAFVHRFASLFIPRQTIWLTVEEPQVLVRFTGKMGPPGTPDLRVELTDVDKGEISQSRNPKDASTSPRRKPGSSLGTMTGFRLPSE